MRSLSRPDPRCVPLASSSSEQLAEALSPCDVLLVEGNTRISAAIKYLTQSTWSHAALYLGVGPFAGRFHGKHVLIEADLAEGIRLVPLAAGFVKVLTVPGKDRILGVTVVGEHAGDLIAEFVLAMRHGIGLNKILGTVHVYPTLAEASKYAAGTWKRNHAPEKLLAWMEKYHAWRRR